MKIYTKKGDKGMTSLVSGERVLKSDIRTEAYGTVDETNSFIGLILSELSEKSMSDQAVPQTLSMIQNELFVLGTVLGTRDTKKSTGLEVSPNSSAQLEKEIDRMNLSLPELKNFILPGGVRTSALAQVARTVTRRAERLCVALNESEKLPPETLVFINRLSDYLFVLARYFNHLENYTETIWSQK